MRQIKLDRKQQQTCYPKWINMLGSLLYCQGAGLTGIVSLYMWTKSSPAKRRGTAAQSRLFSEMSSSFSLSHRVRSSSRPKAVTCSQWRMEMISTFHQLPPHLSSIVLQLRGNAYLKVGCWVERRSKAWSEKSWQKSTLTWRKGCGL